MLPSSILATLVTLVVTSDDIGALTVAREFVLAEDHAGRCMRYNATTFSAFTDGVGIAATGTIRRDDGVTRSVRVLVVSPGDLLRVLSEGGCLHLQCAKPTKAITFTSANMSPRPNHQHPVCQIRNSTGIRHTVSRLYQAFTGDTAVTA